MEVIIYRFCRDAIDSFKSSAYYDEDLGRHVTFQTENLRTPFEDMNKFKLYLVQN